VSYDAAVELDLQVTRTDAGEAVVAVRGAVDLVSKDELLDVALREFERAGIHLVVLDMSGVEFIDSSGLGALVTLDNEATGRGARFLVRDPSARVERILALTGLLDRLVDGA
jgi:anti-sigma B factor antagonist